MLKGPFKVSFDLQGGTGETPLFYVFEGEIPFPKIDVPVLAHYSFAGWALTKATEDFIDKYFNVVDKDETVFAIWSQFDHKVTYSAGEGIGEKEETWVSGETHQFTFPENKEFEKIHFKFIGWKTSVTEDTIYKPGDKLFIEEDITVTAQWERIEVEVVYNAGGGSGTMAKEYKTLKFNAPANKFTRQYYNFTGWKTNITGSTIYKVGQVITVPNTYAQITLTAQWELAGVTITFNGGGGTGSKPQIVVQHSFVAPVHTGFVYFQHDFVGWKTSLTGDTVFSEGQTITFPTTAVTATMTAVWKDSCHLQILTSISQLYEDMTVYLIGRWPRYGSQNRCGAFVNSDADYPGVQGITAGGWEQPAKWYDSNEAKVDYYGGMEPWKLMKLKNGRWQIYSPKIGKQYSSTYQTTGHKLIRLNDPTGPDAGQGYGTSVSVENGQCVLCEVHCYTDDNILSYSPGGVSAQLMKVYVDRGDYT